MIATVWFGCLWCVVGVVWVLGMMRETDALTQNVQLRVALRSGTGTDTVQTIRRALAQMPAVQGVSFKSGRTAAHDFFRSIDVRDPSLEEIISVPDVVIVTPQRDYCTMPRMAMLERTITSTFPEVERVVWPSDLVLSIERRTTDLVLLGSVCGILSIFLFVLALSYAFRAEIHAADSDLAVGWIMGARSWFIAAPHIVVGITATIVGAGVAALSCTAAWQSALAALPWLVRVRPDEVGITVTACAAIGCTISVWQSVAAARQAAKRV